MRASRSADAARLTVAPRATSRSPGPRPGGRSAGESGVVPGHDGRAPPGEHGGGAGPQAVGVHHVRTPRSPGAGRELRTARVRAPDRDVRDLCAGSGEVEDLIVWPAAQHTVTGQPATASARVSDSTWTPDAASTRAEDERHRRTVTRPPRRQPGRARGRSRAPPLGRSRTTTSPPNTATAAAPTATPQPGRREGRRRGPASRPVPPASAASAPAPVARRCSATASGRARRPITDDRSASATRPRRLHRPITQPQHDPPVRAAGDQAQPDIDRDHRHLTSHLRPGRGEQVPRGVKRPGQQRDQRPADQPDGEGDRGRARTQSSAACPDRAARSRPARRPRSASRCRGARPAITIGRRARSDGVGLARSAAQAERGAERPSWRPAPRPRPMAPGRPSAPLSDAQQCRGAFGVREPDHHAGRDVLGRRRRARPASPPGGPCFTTPGGNRNVGRTALRCARPAGATSTALRPRRASYRPRAPIRDRGRFARSFLHGAPACRTSRRR